MSEHSGIGSPLRSSHSAHVEKGGVLPPVVRGFVTIATPLLHHLFADFTLLGAVPFHGFAKVLWHLQEQIQLHCSEYQASPRFPEHQSELG